MEDPKPPGASCLRKIIHIDMDAFFASIEQRDHPELRGKPVIVGGSPGKRGVVSTCSYEARKFGIHSAMASATAARLCPQGIFVRPRMEAYRAVSRQIMNIFQQFTDILEPLSVDEAFLDVTADQRGIGSATRTAEIIRAELKKQTGLTGSAGVSYNKFLAKVASDIKKPDGITVIPPHAAREFLNRLPIGKFYGVGKVTEKKMKQAGIRTGRDLLRMGRPQLVATFGKMGAEFYNFASGIDDRPVGQRRHRKSVGRETTLQEDITDTERMLEIIEALAGDVENSLRKKGWAGHTITVKVKFHDFKSVTRATTLPRTVFRAEEIMQEVPDLLSRTDAGTKKVRLLGVTVSHFPGVDDKPDDGQLLLPFGAYDPDEKGAGF